MRLIAFGCSNTYGEGLNDCWINNDAGPIPSKSAWPQLLANDLKLECINLSVPGASNKQICNNILNFNFKKEDIVVILWTFLSRTCFFQDDGTIKRILIQDIDNKNFDKVIRNYVLNYYKSFYTDTNSNIENWMFINLVNLHLNEQGIINYHFTCNFKQRAGFLASNDMSRPNWSQLDVISLKDCFIDIALDNVHPGLESHRKMNEKIQKIIKG